ncbi:MAG: hypothetical protein ACSLFN_05135 [Candidatus Limnocylindrales bacterium]
MSGAARVVILADDLIWADRLASAARTMGAEVVAVRTLERFEAALADRPFAIVDLTARAYDGVVAIQAAAAAGARCLAVGQHDDHALRKRALAAGAERVYAYRALFEDGPSRLGAWLATAASSPSPEPEGGA